MLLKKKGFHLLQITDLEMHCIYTYTLVDYEYKRMILRFFQLQINKIQKWFKLNFTILRDYITRLIPSLFATTCSFMVILFNYSLHLNIIIVVLQNFLSTTIFASRPMHNSTTHPRLCIATLL